MCVKTLLTFNCSCCHSYRVMFVAGLPLNRLEIGAVLGSTFHSPVNKPITYLPFMVNKVSYIYNLQLKVILSQVDSLDVNLRAKFSFNLIFFVSKSNTIHSYWKILKELRRVISAAH